jgi:hypothetical protein
VNLRISGQEMNDFLPFTTLLVKPYVTFRRAGLLIVYSLLLGLFAPGILEWKLHTFTRQEVIQKLPDYIKDKIESFDRFKASIHRQIEEIDNDIVKRTSISDLKELIENRNRIETYAKALEPPLVIIPYYPDPLILFWSILYLSFFWLIFLFSPEISYKRDSKLYVFTLIGLFIFYRWPTWLRNTAWFQSIDGGRVIYTYPNIDIDKPSFFLQEINALIAAILILELIFRWSLYFSLYRNQLYASQNTDVSEPDKRFFLMRCLCRQFIQWQICSILLACAFLPYTLLFWEYVFKDKDVRYEPSALIVHSLWGLCWIAVSLPFIQTYYVWTIEKAKYACKASESSNLEVLEEAPESSEVKDETQSDKFPDSPIGYVNIITSIIAALSTFGAPLIKALY